MTGGQPLTHFGECGRRLAIFGPHLVGDVVRIVDVVGAVTLVGVVLTLVAIKATRRLPLLVTFAAIFAAAAQTAYTEVLHLGDVVTVRLWLNTATIVLGHLAAILVLRTFAIRDVPNRPNA